MALLLHLLLFLLCFWAGQQGCGKLESVFGPGQGLWLISGPHLLGWVSLNRPQPQPPPTVCHGANWMPIRPLGLSWDHPPHPEGAGGQVGSLRLERAEVPKRLISGTPRALTKG